MMKILLAGIACLFLFLFNRLPVAAQTEPIRVMTFNIRFDHPSDGINSWDNRKNLVTESLQKESPDLIGMQEVLERQAAFLEQHLSGYAYIGVGRDDGKTGGEYSPVFYKKDRLKVAEWGTFWLSQTPHDTGSVGWDAALPRICTWVIFIDIPSGKELFFLNTHFDHIGQTARLESARLIMDFIIEKDAGLPVVVTGDFNCGPDQDPYRVLTDPADGLTDACLLAGSDESCREGTFNGFGSSKENERIDFIFLHRNGKVESYEMLKIKQGEMFISDHYPVQAEISW